MNKDHSCVCSPKSEILKSEDEEKITELGRIEAVVVVAAAAFMCVRGEW